MIARALSVARIHAVAWPMLIAWPLGVLALAFAIPWAIFFLVDTDESNFTGSVSALLGLTLAFYLGAMTQTFPFALGMSVTRRDYYAATLLVAAAQVIGFGTLLTVLAIIENATGGWGVELVMFGVPGYFTSSWLLQFGTNLAIVALVAGAGLLIGAIYQRWRVVGFNILAVTVVLTGGIAAIVITWQRWWPELGRWFVETPRVVPMVVVPAAVALACLLGTWQVMRRATA
ncbi:ABC transporter permease [Nocardia mangyaensis]|uniref:ABC transporter permease n=1 Tax=Nocardia mangyaensis TaxID=2213200 RepID=UPI0026768DB3|nr:ABC transporter permease [Nocardia mangyaensis]MDO3646615.1 ABC transporter permease [Nocardia mangyaensis]